MTPLELFHLVSSWALGLVIFRSIAQGVDRLARIFRMTQTHSAEAASGDHDVIMSIRLRIRAADRWEAADAAERITEGFLKALPNTKELGVIEAGFTPNPVVMPAPPHRKRIARHRFTKPNPYTKESVVNPPGPEPRSRTEASAVDVDGQIFDERSRACEEFPHIDYRIGQTCKCCQWIIGTSPPRFVI